MEKNICVFGASIVYGAYDLEMGGWVNRLRVYLDNKNFEGEIYNLGVSGDNSRRILERIEAEALARKADYTIISIGTNDSSWRMSENNNWVPIDEFEKNLKDIFIGAKKITKEIFFLGILPVDEERTSPTPWNTDAIYKNDSIQKYNQKIKEICEKEDIRFIDLYNDFLKIDYKKLLFDGLHPNTEGHEWIAQKVTKYLNL